MFSSWTVLEPCFQLAFFLGYLEVIENFLPAGKLFITQAAARQHVTNCFGLSPAPKNTQWITDLPLNLLSYYKIHWLFSAAFHAL